MPSGAVVGAGSGRSAEVGGRGCCAARVHANMRTEAGEGRGLPRSPGADPR